jgi:sarcosine oxidase subunit gamma
MLERQSALATAKPFENAKLALGESRGFSLNQAGGFDAAFENAIAPLTGSLPEKVGLALTADGRTVMRTGRRQFWIVGPENDDLAERLAGLCLVTPLSHSRTRISLQGAAAREVLARSIALDFHPAAFAPGMFAMTGIHHTPVLVHCTGAETFHVYALRSFALSVWDWLADAALGATGPSEAQA